MVEVDLEEEVEMEDHVLAEVLEMEEEVEMVDHALAVALEMVEVDLEDEVEMVVLVDLQEEQIVEKEDQEGIMTKRYIYDVGTCQ
jgi:hypothetical protein